MAESFHAQVLPRCPGPRPTSPWHQASCLPYRPSQESTAPRRELGKVAPDAVETAGKDRLSGSVNRLTHLTSKMVCRCITLSRGRSDQPHRVALEPARGGDDWGTARRDSGKVPRHQPEWSALPASVRSPTRARPNLILILCGRSCWPFRRRDAADRERRVRSCRVTDFVLG